MKKILSLVLAISLCLSAVILLASCKGKSAYEIAVENGFVGDEKAWLDSLKGAAGEKGADGEKGKAGAEGYPGLPGDAGLSPYEDLKYNQGYLKTVEEWLASLKGADAKDGHTPVITVDSNGYWVIDGTRQTVKVDGSKAAVVSLELVQNVFSVVKGGEAPKLEFKATLDDGSTAILPVSNSVIAETSYDLTKEGVYDVKLNYGGKTVDTQITVEGLMIYYQNFDTFTNDTKMAELLGETGIRIPTVGPNPARKGTLVETGEEVEMYGHKTWWDDGSDISPYVIYGGYHGAIFPDLSVQNGTLYYFAQRNNDVFTGKASDSMIVIRTDEQMNFAATDTYTIQLDIKLTASTDNGTPEDTSDDVKPTVSVTGNVVLLAKFMSDGSTGANMNRPMSIGAAFSTEYLLGNVYRKGSWYLGNGGTLSAEGIEKYGDQSMNLFQTLFPESTTGSWHGNWITVRIVVNAKTSENPGFTVYVKKATDGEDKFIKVGSYNGATTTTTGMTWFLKEENDGFGIQTRSAATNSGFWVDNIAAWTGEGSMPINTNTATYEDLNTAYNAANNPAA